jgi:hypothetical protein
LIGSTELKGGIKVVDDLQCGCWSGVRYGLAVFENTLRVELQVEPDESCGRINDYVAQFVLVELYVVVRV